MIAPDTILDACRFLHDLMLMALWGMAGFLSFLVPRTLAGAVWRASLPLGTAAALMTAGIMVAIPPLQTAVIAGGWTAGLDMQMVGDMVFETNIGLAWRLQAIAAVLLCLAVVPPLRRRPLWMAIAAGMGLAALSVSGHAAMHPGWRGFVHRANDVVHLICAGGWFGALIPLLPILRRMNEGESRNEAMHALRSFSNVGHILVAGVILSGVANTLLVLGRLPTDWSSPYQLLLSAKIGLVGCMTLLAVANRYVFVPWMRTRPSRAADAIRIGSMAEIGIGVLVVALVAVFGMLEPS